VTTGESDVTGDPAPSKRKRQARSDHRGF